MLISDFSNYSSLLHILANSQFKHIIYIYIIKTNTYLILSVAGPLILGIRMA